MKILKLAVFAFCLLLLSGCDDPDKIGVSSKDPRLSGITVSEANERPEFKRVYETTVTSRGMVFAIKIEARCWWFEQACERGYTANITQPDGKWVLFDPKSPAEKILDRDLVPLVEPVCDRIVAADKAYISAPPAEYTDVSGALWRKK